MEEANTPEASWFWIKLIWTGLYTCDEEFFKWKEDKKHKRLPETEILSNTHQFKYKPMLS